MALSKLKKVSGSLYLPGVSQNMKLSRVTGLILLAFLFGLCCETERTINVEQLHKRDDGLYYADDEKEAFSGKTIEHFQSGHKRMEQTFQNGTLHGMTTAWHENGKKRYTICYNDGEQSGPYQAWYINRQLEKEGSFKNGKPDGKWSLWYINGQQQGEGEYKEGKLQSGWNLWMQDGTKINTGTVTDIDGNIYMTIKIGDHWWMAENLKVTRYRNGDPIPHVPNANDWKTLATDAYCVYDNNVDHADTFGHLYNWYAVNDPRGLAPEGWRVPSDAEWEGLTVALGGEERAGAKMKCTNSWTTALNSTNESGFFARPGGCRNFNGFFLNLGADGTFWSSTEYSRERVWTRTLSDKHTKNYRYHYYSKAYGFSVRCIRD